MFSQPDKLTVCPQAAHGTVTDPANMGECPLRVHIQMHLCTDRHKHQPIFSNIGLTAAQMYNLG